MSNSFEHYALAKERAKKTKKGIRTVLRLNREPCVCKLCRGRKSYPPSVRQEHEAIHGLMTPEPPNRQPRNEPYSRSQRSPPSPILRGSPASTGSSPIVLDDPPPRPSRRAANTHQQASSSHSRPLRRPLRAIDINSPGRFSKSPDSVSAREGLSPLAPRLSHARPSSYFMRTPTPIPMDLDVNLDLPTEFDNANAFVYPNFWSPPAFPSPFSVGSRFTPGSDRSELAGSQDFHSPLPQVPPPSRTPTPLAPPPSRTPTPVNLPDPPSRVPSPVHSVQSSRHSRTSSASSGLADGPVHFASPADDEAFYEDLLGEHPIAPPPHVEPNAHARVSCEPPRDYYQPSEDEDEDDPPNPNGGPSRANSPPDNPTAAANAPPDDLVMDDPGPNDPDGPDDPDDEPFAAFREPARLRNIYIRTYVPSVFSGATKKDTHGTLENIRLALEDADNMEELPADIHDALPKMARTIRSLRHRLGVDTDSLLRIYTLCTACGTRYSSDFINNANSPNCPHLVGDEPCGNPLYAETRLQNRKQSRKPFKSYPYLPITSAIERLLSRPGMRDLMQKWRREGEDDQGVQEPTTRREWLETMPEDRLFGDISEGWGWRSQHAQMTREYDIEQQRYQDLEPEDGPRSLVSLPLGLSLAINFDGFEAHKHKKYEVQGIYIVANNLPSHLRTLIENIMLVMVIPGPNQPTAYELDQILQPLVQDLLELEQGINMPVYDHNTRQMVAETVHARLSLGILDYIARLKITGHAGVASEDNFCLYCTKKLCYLSVREGFQNLEIRNPFRHLQHKYEWLQAQDDPGERERLRKQHGSIFTELDRLPGWYAPACCPIDGMHQFDLGMTKRIYKDILLRPGMLHHRWRQPIAERPLTRIDDFLQRTYFPSHCSRLPPKVAEMKGRVKAEQWRNFSHVMHIALYEAWRVGDAIPNIDLARGGVRSNIYAQQSNMADHLFEARRRVNAAEGGGEEDGPVLAECWSSRNPRDYWKVIMCYLVARNILFSRKHSRADVEFAQQLLWRVNTSFVDMNLPLPPTAHLIMHTEEHILKFGSLYGTSTNAFERANKVLININNNGRGGGCLETTMARRFLERADFFRLVRCMQAIENPTLDDVKTIDVMLKAVRNAPEHEIQRGLLDEVLAGQVPFRGQERIQYPNVSAKADLDKPEHERYFRVLFNHCAAHLAGYNLYTHGRRPPNGVRFPRQGSTITYSHVYHNGFRFGSDSHTWGKTSRYGYIQEELDSRIPVVIKMIYKVRLTTPDNVEHNIPCAIIQRFVAPEHRPQFPWHHWRSRLGTESWVYQAYHEPQAVSIDRLVGVFALTDITLTTGRYWLTVSMDHTKPETVEN